MADLSFFKLDSQTINIKDITALNKINKLESEKADKTLATTSANGLMSAADKKAVDREFFRLLPKGGTYIPPNADLNSIEYIKVGNYYNSLSKESGTIKNIPAITAFMMYVLSPLSEVYDNESTAEWVYRLRIFISFTGNPIFVQIVSSGATVGSFTYGPWVKMTNSNDLGAVSNVINAHIANKANPHGVTKAQVGLGNVDNTSDADKPVSTAVQTALDKKADKTIATASADGLMSAADKKAIDREFFRMLPKGGTYIPANADLNSIEYVKVGNYYNSSIDQSRTIKNIPYGSAFLMYVLSPLDPNYDDEETSKWLYRLRIFIVYNGYKIFTQFVYKGPAYENFRYEPWITMTNSNDLGVALNKINKLEKLSRVSISYDSTKENMTITIGTHSVA